MSDLPVRKQMEQLLQERFVPDYLEVVDESHLHVGHIGYNSTGESHFYIVISSALFDGVGKIDCHRMVYAALDELIKTKIHALRIKIKSRQ